MQLTIATFVSTRRIEGQTQFQASTLGHPRVTASDVLMKGALQKVAVGARKQLQKWVQSGQAQQLSRWLYDPDHEYRLIKLHVTLRDRNVRIKTLLHVFESLEGRFGFFPLLEVPPFQLNRGVKEDDRIQEVLAHWLQAQLKESGDLDTGSFTIEGEAWVEPLDISLESGESRSKKNRKSRGALVDHATSDGAGALHRVGRCLDALVPAECVLFHRDETADRLEQLLSLDRRQGVLLLGASGVGKTAILQEVIRRRVSKRTPSQKHRKNCWLLSPGRVISGMSYLGQWEQRWLSILKEAHKRDHILYFDDVLGLYTAGMTRDSDMCLADVLKAFLAQYPLRLIFEMTPSALSILRRKDRTLVDPLHPFSIDAMNDADTFKTLVDVQGDMEAREQCFFHPGLLPKIVEYSSLMAPHIALPGRAIDLVRGMHRQAVASRTEDSSEFKEEQEETPVLRRTVALSGFDLDAFVRERTGLNLSIREGKADIRVLRTHLEENVLGQPRATEVMARYAARAVHGVHPTDRPLGVFLFMGPTGVGKTESAKALTHLLFEDDTRLIRIDLNEVSSAQAAEELIGTEARPDGRLPTAVRRSPNCVLLLDEIEKAHPDVHDYLLQVIGEGRLSDARGRLVDFRNAFVIMTSNLGSREASSLLGYDHAPSSEGHQASHDAFRRAAKQFFRPEFLNRIDEVVVFDRLEKENMHGIVDLHLKALQQRDGLARRQLYLQVDDDAREWLVNQGYDPALGARAIHRSMEKQVAQPLADHFASTRIDQPCWIRLRKSNEQHPSLERLVSETVPLEVVSAGVAPHDPKPLEVLLVDAANTLATLRSELLKRHHDRENGAAAALSYVDYYACHTVIAEAEEHLREVKEGYRKSKEPSIVPIQSWTKKAAPRLSGRYIDPDLIVRDSVLADLELAESIQESRQKDLGISQEESWRMQIQRKLAIAKQTLRYVDHPKRWFVRIGVLGAKQASSGSSFAQFRDSLLTGQSVRTSGVMLPLQLGQLVVTSLVNHQFEVELPDDVRGSFIVEGTSVYPFIEPLLGIYRVQGRFSFDRLLYIDAVPVEESETFSKPSSLAALEDVSPSDLVRGPYPWPRIRGEVTGSLTDYATGTSASLRLEHAFYRWYMELFVRFAEGGEN